MQSPRPKGSVNTPIAVAVRTIPMFEESARGSLIPEPLKVSKARFIPITVPRKPIMGPKANRPPTAIPTMSKFLFFMATMALVHELGDRAQRSSPDPTLRRKRAPFQC